MPLICNLEKCFAIARRLHLKLLSKWKRGLDKKSREGWAGPAGLSPAVCWEPQEGVSASWHCHDLRLSTKTSTSKSGLWASRLNIQVLSDRKTRDTVILCGWWKRCTARQSSRLIAPFRLSDPASFPWRCYGPVWLGEGHGAEPWITGGLPERVAKFLWAERGLERKAVSSGTMKWKVDGEFCQDDYI